MKTFKAHIIFISIVLWIPGTLHSTRAAWFGFGSRTDLRIVRVTLRPNRNNTFNNKKTTFFSLHYLR